MAYVTYAEYNTYSPGTLEDDAEFIKLELSASLVIDRLTFDRIQTFGLSNFSADTQQRIKDAVMAEIDTIVDQGGLSALTGNTDILASSVKVGKFSESKGGASASGSGLRVINSLPVSPLIRAYLNRTNLLNPAIREYRLEDFR